MPDCAPLWILEGLFYSHPHTHHLTVQTPNGDLSVERILQEVSGTKVSLSVSYLPPSPPLIGVRGLGCCVLPDACGLHLKDPEFLLSFSGEGVVLPGPQGNFLLGGDSLGCLQDLLGHYARVVLFQEPPLQDPTLDLLTQEVSGMSELLKALQREIS
jgi:hypothetical protein